MWAESKFCCQTRLQCIASHKPNSSPSHRVRSADRKKGGLESGSVLRFIEMRWDVFRVWSNPMHIDHICFSTVGLFCDSWCWSCWSFMTYDITNGKLQSYNHHHRMSPGHQPPWSCELAMSKSLPKAWVRWPRILSQNKIRCFISDTPHNTTSYHFKIQLIHHVGEVCWLNYECRKK